jgi:nucleotide-binding universal stress UspA family protein
MFKHILLPTDGSELSETAIHKTVQFASQIGAKVTGFYGMPLPHFSGFYPEIPPVNPEQFVLDHKARAQQYLGVIEKVAQSLNVPCTTTTERTDHPWEDIIRVAQDEGCDLIAMASHGRRGVKSLLMGGETHKVLTHSKIPVLVFR